MPARPAGGPQYSYAKATRYDDRVVQLGPLADLVVGRDPLITSLFHAQGPNTWLRQFARFHRPVQVLESMRQTLHELERTPRRADVRALPKPRVTEMATG